MLSLFRFVRRENERCLLFKTDKSSKVCPLLIRIPVINGYYTAQGCVCFKTKGLCDAYQRYTE